jgi:glycosyltransferase involved in cell wall biosynthesis
MYYLFYPQIRDLSNWCTIDFVEDVHSRPLHLSLRADERLIVINAMVDGEWGEETQYPYEFVCDAVPIISIGIEGFIAEIAINGVSFVRKVLKSRGGPLDVQSLLSMRVLPMASATDECLLSGVVELRFAGESFSLVNLLRDDEVFLREALEPFLSHHVLTPTDGVVLDLSQTHGAAGAILQRLMPSARVFVAADDEAAVAARTNAKLNGADNLIIATPIEIAAGLSELTTKGEQPNQSSLGAQPTGAATLAQSLLERPLSVVVARDSLFGDGPLAIALQKVLATSTTAMCADEARLPDWLGPSLAASQPRDLRVKLTGTNWILRTDRLGAITRSVNRLDIGVAMYNTGPFIEKCLETLLAADREDVRVLLVDDGSTDNSMEIVRKQFGGHPRLLLLSKPNGGCASARNYARIHSDAAYIAFVDADDFVDEELFPALLDLARFSGNEVVQGGFSFHENGVERDSYEVGQFRDRDRMLAPHGGTCFRVPASDLIAGQPTIWRRVYRRDFIDNNALWFPEHIRAFDDLIFHLQTVLLARDVLTVDGLNYHYRQHPAQDIKQGDERHFYALEMFRALAKRAIRQGWNNFHLFVPTLINTLNWSLERLREDLVSPFLEGSAELWVMLEIAFGRDVLGEANLYRISHFDFPPLVERLRQRANVSKMGFAAMYTDSSRMHPGILLMQRALGLPIGR